MLNGYKNAAFQPQKETSGETETESLVIQFASDAALDGGTKPKQESSILRTPKKTGTVPTQPHKESCRVRKVLTPFMSINCSGAFNKHLQEMVNQCQFLAKQCHLKYYF